MAYLTDRKRATGWGSAKSGTRHHWLMMVTSVGLLVLVPLFVFTFGTALGMSHAEAVAYYQRPFPAIVALLTLGVGFYHFALGAQTLIEDYVGGLSRKIGIIAVICLSTAAAAAAIFAVIVLAL